MAEKRNRHEGVSEDFRMRGQHRENSDGHRKIVRARVKRERTMTEERERERKKSWVEGGREQHRAMREEMSGSAKRGTLEGE